MIIQTQYDVVPGSIWTGINRDKFIVRSVTAQGSDVWVYYELMGTRQSYSCLVEAFQQRFNLYINHNYEGPVWKLSSM